MKKVFKYDIKPEHIIEIQLPKNAEILTAQTQLYCGTPMLWALVDPDAKPELRKFRLAGTGHQIDETNLKYINTFQLNNGLLVFHLFEIL